MTDEEFDRRVMATLRDRLAIRISVRGNGDKIHVTAELVDTVTNREIARDTDFDSVTIYQSDIR